MAIEIKITEHPELTEKYSAIDGIAKPETRCGPDNEFIMYGQKPIRSDIETILKLEDFEFEKWYTERKEATERLLKDYKVFASIPCLAYGTEEQKLDMTAYSHVRDYVKSLEEASDYLEVMKRVRTEVRGLR
jgi:hypothetical protein